MIENSYYQKNFSHDGQILSETKKKKGISPAKTGVHASVMYVMYVMCLYVCEYVCVCLCVFVCLFVCVCYACLCMLCIMYVMY